MEFGYKNRTKLEIELKFAKKLRYLLELCVSSLPRGHANLLCIVPILTDEPKLELPTNFRQYIIRVTLNNFLIFEIENVQARILHAKSVGTRRVELK